MLVGRAAGATEPIEALLPVDRGREKLVVVDCEEEGREASDFCEPAVDGRVSTSRAILCGPIETRLFESSKRRRAKAGS